MTVEGRPLLNASFAINYLISELNSWSYHGLNILIHAANACLLYLVCKRYLNCDESSKESQTVSTSATQLSLAIAVLWGVHPITTECVVYSIQRAESLASLFYLLSFYFFLLHTNPRYRSAGLVLCVVSCVAGVATKEILVSLPILILLYDRLFLSQSFLAALLSKPVFYVGLWSSYLLLVLLMNSSGSRGGTIGFGSDTSSFEYLITQSWGIVRYLRLCFWPAPLIFDYGAFSFTFGQVWLHFLFVAGLFIGTLVLLFKKPRVGFVLAAFFLLLAPTSSFVPIVNQTVSEHRMYLVSAFILGLGVVLIDRTWHKSKIFSESKWARATVLILIAVAFGTLTIRRNLDYGSGRQLWADTVQKWDLNGRAFQNLTVYLMKDGQYEEARVVVEKGCQVDPNNPRIFSLAGLLYLELSEPAKAVRAYSTANQIEDKAGIYGNRNWQYLMGRAKAHLQLDNPAEAKKDLIQSTELRPDNAEAIQLLGIIHEGLGEYPAAKQWYDRLIEIHPSADTYCRRGFVLIRMNQGPAAMHDFDASLKIDPNFGFGYLGRAQAYVLAGDLSKARAEASIAERLGMTIDLELQKKLYLDSKTR